MAEKYDSDSVVRVGYLKYVTDYLEDKIDVAFRGAKFENNTLKLFSTTDTSTTPAFTCNFPAEMYLDTTRTVAVNNFTFNSSTYPGATDPNLDGKPVIVLAIKSLSNDGLTQTTSYSFLDASALMADLKNYIRTIEETADGVIFKDGNGTQVYKLQVL